MSYGIFDASMFGKVFSVLKDMGIFEYILPWMLYYAIIYGLLTKINVFGKENGDNKIGDKVNRIVALSIATLILYYVPQSRMLSDILAELFTKWSVFAITLLLIPLTISLLGIDIKGLLGNDSTTKLVITGIIILVIFFIFYGTLGKTFKEFWWIIDPYNIAIAITLVVLAFIIANATGLLSGEGESSSSS